MNLRLEMLLFKNETGNPLTTACIEDAFALVVHRKWFDKKDILENIFKNTALGMFLQ